MAPPMARLPAARRAAAADAQPQAARNRGARSAWNGNQPGAETMDRLVRERHLAGDGLPDGSDRFDDCRTLGAIDRRPRDRAAGRLSRAQRASRSRCSITGWRIGTFLFFATLVVSDITLVGLATGEPFVTSTAIGSRWFRQAFRRSARPSSESASRPISAVTRCARWRPPTRCARSTHELRKDVEPVARRRSRRAGRAVHALRPRRVAAGQPAARSVGRLALHEIGDRIDQLLSTGSDGSA